jgi:heme-degrading monooxygenase HmoA
MILVVFRSRNRPDGDLDEYSRRSKRLHELVQQHPGFISIESFETPDGEEVSLELFENDASVKAWRDNTVRPSAGLARSSTPGTRRRSARSSASTRST